MAIPALSAPHGPLSAVGGPLGALPDLSGLSSPSALAWLGFGTALFTALAAIWGQQKQARDRLGLIEQAVNGRLNGLLALVETLRDEKRQADAAYRLGVATPPEAEAPAQPVSTTEGPDDRSPNLPSGPVHPVGS